MEHAQAKSLSEMKVAIFRDSVETDSEALSEKWMESTLSAGTEKLFSLKSHSFLNCYFMFESVQARK